MVTQRSTVRTEVGAGTTPACPKCGDNKHVIRMWHGRMKVWVCSIHYQIKSTETVPQSLRERLLRRPLEEKAFDLTEVFPNRAARRHHGKAQRSRP